jgi:hypothetical protein
MVCDCLQSLVSEGIIGVVACTTLQKLQLVPQEPLQQQQQQEPLQQREPLQQQVPEESNCS